MPKIQVRFVGCGAVVFGAAVPTGVPLVLLPGVTAALAMMRPRSSMTEPKPISALASRVMASSKAVTSP
ncbi:hypothetical protein D3C86_2237810 [compost metagenome]